MSRTLTKVTNDTTLVTAFDTPDANDYSLKILQNISQSILGQPTIYSWTTNKYTDGERTLDHTEQILLRRSGGQLEKTCVQQAAVRCKLNTIPLRNQHVAVQAATAIQQVTDWDVFLLWCLFCFWLPLFRRENSLSESDGEEQIAEDSHRRRVLISTSELCFRFGKLPWR